MSALHDPVLHMIVLMCNPHEHNSFSSPYANRRRPPPGDQWHLDEGCSPSHGERHDLWRAVDQDDHILDIPVQRRRNQQAAQKFCRQVLKRLPYVPRGIRTDQLKSYGAVSIHLDSADTLRQEGPDWMPTLDQSGSGYTPRRKAVRAAKYPHIPCTPPPGGVEDEQMYSPWTGVAYGTRRSAGRVKSWRRSCTPPLMSPPM